MNKRKEQKEKFVIGEIKEILKELSPVPGYIISSKDDDFVCPVCGLPDNWWNGHPLYKHYECDEVLSKSLQNYKMFLKMSKKDL